MKKILKYLFHSIPCRPEIFSMIRKFYSPKGEVYKHLYFQGKFKTYTIGGRPFFMNNYCTPFENVIFWEGMEKSWERYSIKIWEKLAVNADVIFDVGANTGVYSLVAKTSNPNAQVYAFEPLKRMYERLLENIALNNYSINSFQIAIADYDGEATIYDLPQDIMRQATLNQSALKNGTQYGHLVPVSTLSTFIEQYDLMQVDLIKIDVETYEPQVLAGMGEYIGKYKPVILLEVLNMTIANEVQEILDNANYECFYRIDEDEGLMQTKRIDGSPRKNYLSRNYLCAFSENQLDTIFSL